MENLICTKIDCDDDLFNNIEALDFEQHIQKRHFQGKNYPKRAKKPPTFAGHFCSEFNSETISKKGWFKKYIILRPFQS